MCIINISLGFRSVRAAFEATVDKMLKKFPFHSPVLKAVRILNPANREEFNDKESERLFIILIS